MHPDTSIDLWTLFSGLKRTKHGIFRGNKGLRSIFWIVNAFGRFLLVNYVLNKKSNKSVDIQIFYYKQCFDSLWLQECMNDVYSAGLNDDKFALLYNANKLVNITVKTPVGRTERKSMCNVITQGDVFSPMFVAKQ